MAKWWIVLFISLLVLIDVIFSMKSWILHFSSCNFVGEENDTVEVVPDIRPTVKAAAIAQMDAAVVALSRELSKLRTGRASAGMLLIIILWSPLIAVLILFFNSIIGECFFRNAWSYHCGGKWFKDALESCCCCICDGFADALSDTLWSKCKITLCVLLYLLPFSLHCWKEPDLWFYSKILTFVTLRSLWTILPSFFIGKVCIPPIISYILVLCLCEVY